MWYIHPFRMSGTRSLSCTPSIIPQSFLIPIGAKAHSFDGRARVLRRLPMRHLLAFLLLTATVIASAAQNDPASRIEARFDEAKPDAKRLAFFSLDWEMTLQDAKTRAAKEHRPVLVIL